MNEVWRVLAPDGVAYIQRDGHWKKHVKPRSTDIDEWTHFFYNASGNAVSQDQRVAPTRYLKWVTGPLWSRSHEYTPSMAAMVSARGRIISIQDEGIRGVTDPRIGDRWMIQARDAFNGLLLWQRPMAKDWGTAVWGGDRNWGTPMSIPRRLVAVGDRVYVTLGYRAPVTVLDARSGETVQVLNETQNTDELILDGKTLLARRRKKIPNYSPKASAWKVQLRRGETPPPAVKGSETITAINIENGKLLWHWNDSQVVTLTLAAATGRVCYHNFEEIICLNEKTGRLLWRVPCPSWPDLIGTSGTLVMYQDLVFYAGDRGLHAYDATNGKLLWKGPRMRRTGVRHTADLLIADGLLWSGITADMATGQLSKEESPHAVPAFTGSTLKGLDPRTGQVRRQIEIGAVMSTGHHIRCYRSKATERFLMWPKRGTEYIDIIDGRDHMRTDWLRGECSYGVMPSDGLVYVPPHPCICSPGVKLEGFFAASARPAKSTTVPGGPRLQKGPAFATEIASASYASEDWPMYRHDLARSGSTPSAVAPLLALDWKKYLGGKLTQTVIVGGHAIIASTDQHTVYALDAATGQLAWSFVAGGRIDSVPAVSEGRVLFGSHDGWVYCLRESDGSLAWRFRAAPQEVLVTAFEQLESLWPVLGSVLVHQNVVYATAGRSSFLDGGMHFYALDLKTGRVVHHRHLKGPWPDASKDVGDPYGMLGTKPDLLTFNGTALSMGPHEYKLSLEDHQAFQPDRDGSVRKSDRFLMASSGFLDDTWHDRTMWTYSRLWPGRDVFSTAHVAPKSGQLVVFDQSDTYSVKAFMQKSFMSPRHVPGTGYGLVADRNENEPGKNFRRQEPPRWQTVVPLRARGLLLSSNRIFLAGCQDITSTTDPTASYEGRGKAVLWSVSASDGKKLESFELGAPPVNDGLSAARGRLYISATDGTVNCLAPVEAKRP